MINFGGARVANLLPNALIVTRSTRRTPKLYLTFDDGPEAEITPLVCSLLKKYNLKASFFCVGENIEKHPEIVRQLVDSGHVIANHSETHKDFMTLSFEAQESEVENCQRRIEKLNPTTRKIFRAPRGRLGLLSLIRFRLKGWKVIHWSFDSLDHEKNSLERHLASLRDKPPSNGDILLFHDDDGISIEILTVMIPEWIERGFSFATIDELL